MIQRVCVVDDDVAVLDSLSRWSDKSAAFRCACFSDSIRSLSEIQRDPPAAVLMDIRMTGLSGIACTKRLHAALPRLPVVMYTACTDRSCFFRSMAAGARGFLHKPMTPDQVFAALRDGLSGGVPLSRNPKIWLFEDWSRRENGRTMTPHLSERERQIVRGLARGQQRKEIAGELGVSVNTVRTHLARIYERLAVRSKAEAIERLRAELEQGP